VQLRVRLTGKVDISFVYEASKELPTVLEFENGACGLSELVHGLRQRRCNFKAPKPCVRGEMKFGQFFLSSFSLARLVLLGASPIVHGHK
jgi:hypothetical protein